MRTALSVLAVLAVALSTQAAKQVHAPLPVKVLTAKKIFIENHGSAVVADQAYSELTKWGRFEIVDSSDKADIVLVLSITAGEDSSGRTKTYDPKANNGYGGWKYGRIDSSSPGYTYITVKDAKTGDSLYADSRQWTSFSSATRKLIQGLRKRIEQQEKESH
jgi:hypothetical protein